MTWLYLVAIGAMGIAFYLGRQSVNRKKPPALFVDEKGNRRPFYEDVPPGKLPTKHGLPGSGIFGYKQGGLLVLTCFRGLWGSPKSGDAPKPPSSTERSSQ